MRRDLPRSTGVIVRILLEVEEFVVLHLFQDQRIYAFASTKARLTTVVPGIFPPVVTDGTIPGRSGAASGSRFANPDHTGSFVSTSDLAFRHTPSILADTPRGTEIAVIATVAAQGAFPAATSRVADGENTRIEGRTLQSLTGSADPLSAYLKTVAHVSV